LGKGTRCTLCTGIRYFEIELVSEAVFVAEDLIFFDATFFDATAPCFVIFLFLVVVIFLFLVVVFMFVVLVVVAPPAVAMTVMFPFIKLLPSLF